MRVCRSEASSAITIVNAIPCGKGVAMGIDLWARVEVKHVESREIRIRAEGDVHDERFVSFVVTKVMREHGATGDVTVSIRSDIPPGSGLKSSSAVSVALIDSVLKCLDVKASPLDVLRMSARLCREYGVSVTGALDDAAASLLGGVQYTDNARDLVLLSRGAPRDVRIFIYVPSGVERRLSEEAVSRMRSLRSVFERVFELSLVDIWSALTINGILISDALQYNTKLILNIIHRLSPLAAGISGNGPAVVVVDREDRAEHIREYLSRLPGRVLEVRPVDLRAAL